MYSIESAIILELGGEPKLLNRAVITDPAQDISNGYRSANRSIGLSGVVLVVDDEALLRRMMRRTLERLGIEVIEAVNGVEAVETLKRSGDRVDLVLMDWNMPILSGEETIQGFREIYPEIPVIVTSGFDALHLGLKKMPVEIQGFLQKPFRTAGLESVLRTHLAN